jgi:hypothetical protein
MATMESHIETIRLYVEGGCEPGSGTRAILENDLLGACQNLDKTSQAILFDIVKYLYNNVPMNCWGSPERVRDWIKRKREENRRTAESAAEV